MSVIVGTSGPDTVDGTAGNDFLYGLEDDDTLNGLAGNDYLDGGTGNDIMNGGADDDVYIVDALGDVVNESVGQGFDIIYALASYILAAGINIERLSSTDHLDTTAKDLTGNDYVTDIYGNNGVNVLTGGAAGNTILGFGGTDTLNGLAGDDRLYGMDGTDTLNGGANNDYFDGGAGTDVLNGGTGDDIFLVDSSDTVGELTGEGFDIVYAITSYVLAAGAYVERLSSTDHLDTTAKDLTGNDYVTDIYGNAGTNVLTGGAANNIILGFGGTDTLNGLAGDDRLYGMDGNDTINGGANNDYFDGGAGNDTMNGGTGDDIFLVDSGDTIVELFNEGFDIVYAIGNYVLGASAHVEVLIATNTISTDARNLTGNDVTWEIYGNNGVNILTGGAGASALFGLGGDDTLIGNAGNDILIGGSGYDIMRGGLGDDTYYVEQSQDIVSEGDSQGTNEGNDIVYSYVDYRLGETMLVETLAAVDSAADTDMRLYGNAASNHISGDIGDNLLDTGEGGTDLLSGLAGADIFNFRNVGHEISLNRAVSLGVATIDDFVQGTDLLRLDVTKFTGILGNASFFEIGATATAATTRILYDSATGNLIYDTDGNAPGVSSDAGAVFGKLQTGLTLTAGDFIIEANQAPEANDDSYAMVTAGVDQTITIDMKQNDFDGDGYRLWVTKMGLDAGSLVTVSTGLSSTAVIGTYGRLEGGSKGNTFSYRLDWDDPDTLAIAPGTSVTETFVYEVTDGMGPAPLLQLQGFALYDLATITITISRSASGAMMSQVSASDALAPQGPPADDHAAFASVSDEAFAPVGGGDDTAASPNLHAAADYLVQDLWIV
jgi:Ca2+-binding RTX toxin-like protein